jgi:outer membrane protein OmpA-like peptidoglycan-associated protein
VLPLYRNDTLIFIITPTYACGELKMKSRVSLWMVFVTMTASVISVQVSAPAAIAGSVNFLTGGTVTVPYNEKFDAGNGAFTLEMWVRETAARPAQYTAQFFRGTKMFNWDDRVNKSSWGLGVSFDGEHLYLAPEVGKWPTPAVLSGGTNNGYADAQTSNTKTVKQIYETFTDLGWHHIAVSKTGVGGVLSTYLDGVRVIYAPNDNNSFMMYGGDVLIGGGKFVGQIGDVRLVKGQALYSGPSITVPTSQITTTSQGAIASNVSLLLKAGGGNCAIEDFSDNHFSVLINGASCTNAASRAITSYNLQFDNQGHGTKPADLGNINQIAAGSLPTIAKDGIYVLLGWSETPSGSIITGTYAATTDSTLYAIWAQAPNAPTATSVALTASTSALVSFLAPGSNGGAAIESYTVITTPDSVVAYAIGSGSGSATLSGLRPGTTYSITVRAGNAAGRSVSSNALTLTIPISPVLGAWPNISKYKSDAPFALTPPTESYTAAGTFGFTSSNSGIVSISGETVTVVQAGSAVITATFYPTDTATYLSGVTKTMTISVSAASNAITFGSISSRAVNSGGFNLAATALGGTVTYSSATSASICTVTNGGAVSMFAPGTCVITASSLGNANYGAASDVTQNLVITAAPPGAPTLTSVSVGGTDASVATSGYATLQFTANTENGGTITSYVLTATPATGSAVTKTVTAAAGTRTDSITALSLGVSYTFSVTAYNGGTAGGGTSAASNSVIKTPAANPNAPTNLRVASGDTTLTANWTPPVSLGGGTWDSYRVFIKRSSDATFSDTPTIIINTQATSTYQFTSLTNGVAYDVKIWVKTTSFTTELLANTAAVYLIPATVPTAPRIGLAQTDSTTVLASWASNGDGGSALTGYTLTLSSGACSYSFVSGTTSYSCTITGLTAGNTVTASLVAVNGVGSSAPSSASVNYITGVGAPTSVVVTNGDGKVGLAFALNNGGDAIVSFDYSVDGLSYSPLNATSSPVTITGLTNDVAYNLYLRAKGATYGNGPSSSVIAVFPQLTVIPVTQVVVIPSYLKAVTFPTISNSKNGYICARGTYQFVRSSGGAETASLTSAVFSLFINGIFIESATSTSLYNSFDKPELLEASTIYCSVTISQEGTIQQFKSLDNSLTRNIAQIKNDAFDLAAADYQIARDSAYALRIQGNAESTLIWRKSLDAALAKRSYAEESTTASYLKSLEEAGISLFVAAPEVKKPDPKVDPKEPEKANTQPTSVMRKVGTIYFANGTYFINEVSRKSLLAIAKKISSGSAKMILSYGHTDSTKGVDNTLLSKNRARAVASVLREILSGKKIVTGWYASTQPVSTGTSKADLAKNRRVEIYIK